MKKIITLLLVMITSVILTSCNQELSALEKRIREFDYYTEIFDYRSEYKSIKLLAAYNEGSTEITYLYYMNEVQSDYEVLFFHGEELIHEDFIVFEYLNGEEFLGEFNGTSLNLEEDVTLIDMRLVYPGGGDSIVAAYFVQEFYMVTTTEQVTELHREFVSTKDFINKDIVIDEFNVVGEKQRNAFFIVLTIGVVLYFICLYSYKDVYSKHIQKQLVSEVPLKRKLPDLPKYKYISAIVLLVLVIITTIITTSSISANYESIELYDNYDATYEEIVSDRINLTIGGTFEREVNMAYVESGSTHYIPGYVFIILEDGTECRIKPSREWKIFYRFIDMEYIQVEVREFNEDLLGEDDDFLSALEPVFVRKLYFDYWRR